MKMDCSNTINAINMFLWDQLFEVSEYRLNFYNRAIRDFFNHFPGKVTEVTTKEVKTWLVYQLVVYGNKPATVTKKLKALKCFFSFCCNEKLVSEDPTEKVGFPTGEMTLIQYYQLGETL